ncbi:MAG: hypothetical protein KDA33_14960 [Phycisphaerales bacterium]|nr:hypothetical protein [Phycisphaerales bacterium]
MIRMQCGFQSAARTIVLAGVVITVLTGAVAAGQVAPEFRTAEMPDSWLVVYNASLPDSVAWAMAYQQARDIPEENMLGVSASAAEHLDTQAEAEAQIIGPVRTYLTSNPDIEQHIMGILVGYGVPGSYASPPTGGPGGFSIPDALEDMWDDTEPPADQKGNNVHDNPQFISPGLTLPPEGRLTKATMDPGRYMVARIDAPTLTEAIDITSRAVAFELSRSSIVGQNVFYDYMDFPALPSGEWVWLRRAVEEPDLVGTPWQEFDSDTETISHAAFRFGTHALTGWNDNRLYGGDPGAKILAYNFNSYGATTVRSTTAQGGRYVPNALAAGYLAAIGATGEPQCCLGPIPETIIAGLREGWTIGESFHIASVYDDWMWTLFADPLLKVPSWFDDDPVAVGTGDGNGDGAVDGLDIAIMANVLAGSVTDPVMIAAYDLTQDGEVNDDDAFLMLAPALFDTMDADVLRGGGDLNGDHLTNGRDLEVFVDILMNGEDGVSVRARLRADMNRDGVVDLNDVELFVFEVTHSGVHGDKSSHQCVRERPVVLPSPNAIEP